jgi:uncharacterized protein (DUF1501 family)
MCEKDIKTRKGKTIVDASAHEEEHKGWNRRDFLQSAGLFTAGMAATLGGVPVYALGNAWKMAPLSALESDRVLVLIQMRGGNDGLNMVIDRFNSEYYNIRPTLGIAEANLWALDAKTGMSNRMIDLQPMWNDGKMKVIHNVGYPDPNYSHFRSSDIWASASDTDEYVNTGWIGRYIQHDLPAYFDAQPTVPPAMQIGVQTDLIFQGDEVSLALAVSSPQEFYKLASSGQLYDLDQLGEGPRDRELFYLRQVANSAFRYSQSISEAYNKGRNEVNYPNSNLAQQLAIVSRLIKGRLGTKVYLVYIDGFDTHAEQLDRHLGLLNNLSSAVKAFYDDLGKGQMDDKVLGMTFSEFGRTIYENGSAGTDHGTGGPMLMFAKDLGQDIVGNPPDLLEVDQYGDPYFETDFRDVYASVLGQWFGLPKEVTDFIVGKEREGLPGLLPQQAAAIGTENFGALLGHRMDEQRKGILLIRYAVNQGGPAILEILNEGGQVTRTLLNQNIDKGSHTMEVDVVKQALRPGNYTYRLKVGGKIYQRKLVITE